MALFDGRTKIEKKKFERWSLILISYFSIYPYFSTLRVFPLDVRQSCCFSRKFASLPQRLNLLLFNKKKKSTDCGSFIKSAFNSYSQYSKKERVYFPVSQILESIKLVPSALAIRSRAQHFDTWNYTLGIFFIINFFKLNSLIFVFISCIKIQVSTWNCKKKKKTKP